MTCQDKVEGTREQGMGEQSTARLTRRSLFAAMAAGSALGLSGCGVSPLIGVLGNQAAARSESETVEGDTISVSGPAAFDAALRICAGVYPANRRQDMLSSTNKTGFRMTVSPNGFPVAICMCPDLTFGVLGSRFLRNRDYLDTFRGHLDYLPRNMRRNGRFFINEDQLAGADRVMSQVMYPLWVWELYRATGDRDLLEFHHEPLLRCLAYIESRTDSSGVVTQVEPDDWQYSEGADWVDWCPERMEGSTCVYHAWYARALEGCVGIFRELGDEEAAAMCRERAARQRRVLDEQFWNGTQYWDNLNFQGEKVGRFWCDSQLWPITWGYASPEQAAAVFARIDAEPAIFEGVPTRWCAPIAPGDEDPRYLPGGKYGDTPRPELREYSWFGRLGAGDILARYQTRQDERAVELIRHYAEIVAALGTVPECLDMQGKPQRGTGGEGDYLEHAGGFLWCVGAGLFGIDDAVDGTLVWTPRLPDTVVKAVVPFWRHGRCWEFGCNAGQYWIDPHGAQETIKVVRGDTETSVTLDGSRVSLPRSA